MTMTMMTSWLFLCLLWSVRGGDVNSSNVPAIERMEDLAEQALEALNRDTREIARNYAEALLYLEKAVEIFDADGCDASDTCDGVILSSVVGIYAQSGEVSLTLAEYYQADDPAERQSSLQAADKNLSNGLRMVQKYVSGFGFEAQMHFWESLARCKTLQKDYCAASAYYEQVSEHNSPENPSELETDDLRSLVESSKSKCAKSREEL
jgi:tetratricopeptide (TPR) repeat protein